MRYLSEIKNRFILVIINWFSILLIIYFYKEIILFFVIEPNVLISLKKYPHSFYFIFTDAIEIFYIYSKIIFFWTKQLCFVYIVYHFFFFWNSALFYSEYLYFRFILKIIFFMWFFFVFFNNYWLIPLTWHFFLSFQYSILHNVFTIHFEPKLKEYFVFYISSYYISQLYFQFLLIYLVLLNYVKYNSIRIRKFRKISYYKFIFFSMLISPPDLLNQIFISLILMFIHELAAILFLLKTFKIKTKNSNL